MWISRKEFDRLVKRVEWLEKRNYTPMVFTTAEEIDVLLNSYDGPPMVKLVDAFMALCSHLGVKIVKPRQPTPVPVPEVKIEKVGGA